MRGPIQRWDDGGFRITSAAITMRFPARASLAAALFTLPLAATAEIPYAAMQACPLGVADFQAVPGINVRDGAAGPAESFGNNRAYTCRYEGADRGFLAITQFWAHAADVAKTREAMKRVSPAFRTEVLAADADGAIVILDPNDANRIQLRYMRKNVMTEVLLVGLGKGDDLKDRLLKLKRVP